LIAGAAVIGSLAGGIPLIGGFAALASAVVIGASFLFLIVSAMYVLAGNWLWKSLKKGGVLGIILSIIGIIISIVTLPIPVIGGPSSIIGIIIDILMLILLAVGWRELR
jgi:hypothetical protein